MSIDFDRICKLAGLASSNRPSQRPGRLNESYMSEEEGHDEGMHHMEEDMDEDMHEDMDEDMDEELVEVDMSELMSEIRRAKRIMKNNQIKKQRLQEAHLKRVIQKEVESVLSEIEDRDAKWLYGKRQPRRSKRGYSAQGSYIPGIGFK